jgi:hypothetical protein
MGILGRPRRRKDRALSLPEAARETPGAALLRRQLTGSDPVLAKVAEEAMRADAAFRGKTKKGPANPRISAGFNASTLAQPPSQGQRYPTPPHGPISASQRDRYGRALAASIRARTAPVLLSKDEVLAAFDEKRIPVDLPFTKTEGRVVYQRDDVRTLLLGGTLPPTDRVPRCRYCGRVSNFGRADMVCDRCEKTRAQIETGAMSQFSIPDRRGWRGPQTIGDDELLLAIQRRLRDADHRALETAEREKRHAERARRWAKQEPELEAAE